MKRPPEDSTERPTRPYRSVRRRERAAQTRKAAIEAATALFEERGWTGTSMRDVAAAAGVSVETIYSAIGTKAELLSAALDVGVVGDDAPRALRERPEFLALGAGERAERFAAVGRLMRAIYARSAGLDRVIREAAYAEPALAARRARGLANQRRDTEKGASLVLGRTPTSRERDEIWAVVCFDTYDNLTRLAGWSDDQYEHWIADVLSRMFPTTA